MSMKCPKCKSQSYVLEAREHKQEVRRRRKCKACGYRWRTHESETYNLNEAVDRLAREIKPILDVQSQLAKRFKHLEGEIVVVTDELMKALKNRSADAPRS